ncbi:MAG: peptide ligase PGM1-related protein [Thermodesulfobacteriota bacterium]
MSRKDPVGKSAGSSMSSDEERREFAKLQGRLVPIYRDIFPNRVAPRTVIIVPSLSLDEHVLAKVPGIHHYEERMLCLLILLRMPRTKLVFVTSQPIHDSIIDYYLHLLPGIPGRHARSRLTLLTCYDASPIPLTKKILERPRLLESIRRAIDDPSSAHMSCFNSTNLERTLAMRLGIPLYGCDPDLTYLGSKSSSREIFRSAGVDLPDGLENLRDEQEMVNALAILKRRNPSLKRALVKLNEGFSGEGNALFDYDIDDADLSEHRLIKRIRDLLPTRIRFEAAGGTFAEYSRKFREMGGIVECWVEGKDKRSPSVQFRIDPLGEINILSTHDQVLGGPNGQIYLGCSFPADEVYRLEIQEAGLRIARILQQKGVLNIFGVDFVSVKSGNRWKHNALEINLRKGGTTFPYLALEFLTDGRYDPQTGLFRLSNGQPRFYYASDNFQKARYKGLIPDDLIDMMVYNELHFDSATQQGVVFHLMGALSEFGKFGVTCIGENPERAREFYAATMAALDRETRSY